MFLLNFYLGSEFYFYQDMYVKIYILIIKISVQSIIIK